MHGTHPHIHDSDGNAIVIDPITRIEGHMRVEAVVDGGAVKDARCCGTLFRGFERILPGRHPLDAVRITQRVCGVCPTAHASASAFCLDEALGVADKVPPNGRLVRNLILGANFLQSHILHFFTLAALDYADVAALADYEGDESELKAVRAFIDRGELGPFFPRYEGDYRCSKDQNRTLVRNYLRALHIRRVTHEMLCIFGGKMPHNIGIVPGGVTCDVTADKISSFAGKLADVKAFIDDAYIPSVLLVAGRYADHFEIGAGCKRYLSYGVFNLDEKDTNPVRRKRLLPAGLVDADGKLSAVDAGKITEHVKHSRYDESCAAHPAEGTTCPDPGKAGAYSWLKAPRYDGGAAEVGPLARAMVGYVAGDKTIKADVDAVLSAAGISADKLSSVLGRHAARALEAQWVCNAMAGWLVQLAPSAPAAVELTIPDAGQGAGMTDAPRGALGHWIQIKDKKIDRYQLVVPTTWNASPRDAEGTPGPIEQALIGAPVKDRENPFEIVRTVRSFDPCLACAVHVLTARGRKIGEYRIV
ncbi:MAG TPA: nickel-dependent hydrogenase large subunit [Phycisphaerae bacterium]|nr:nickel-dependent hydrogenase large subunit [Phycisphaerae bacterium]